MLFNWYPGKSNNDHSCLSVRKSEILFGGIVLLRSIYFCITVIVSITWALQDSFLFVWLSLQRQMIIQDKQVKELNDAKNAVEEYVYDLRDKLCGIYEKYITEEVIL